VDRTPRRTLAVRIARRIGLVSAVAIPVVYLAVSLLSAHLLTRTNNQPSHLDPRAVGPDAVAWSTRTADGLTLRGWFYPRSGPHRLVILVHGMGGSLEAMAELGRDLHGRGYAVLLFDLRGHGGSDPARLSMGRRERADLRAVMAWAGGQGYGPDRIGWVGQSMGASTILMEGEQNLDIRVAVVDSPFGDLPALLNTQLARHSHLPSVFNPGILLAAHRAYGVRTDDLKPIRSVRRWGSRPLLLIHGEADSIVPVGQARDLARAAGPSCRAVTLPGVEHVGAYHRDPGRYVAAVDGFLKAHLR